MNLYLLLKMFDDNLLEAETADTGGPVVLLRVAEGGGDKLVCAQWLGI
jgi:hypothetical protein